MYNHPREFHDFLFQFFRNEISYETWYWEYNLHHSVRIFYFFYFLFERIRSETMCPEIPYSAS